MEKQNKKTTSVRIDSIIWQKFRILCLKRQIDASEWIEELIKKEVVEAESKEVIEDERRRQESKSKM